MRSWQQLNQRPDNASAGSQDAAVAADTFSAFTERRWASLWLRDRLRQGHEVISAFPAPACVTTTSTRGGATLFPAEVAASTPY